MKKYSSVNKQFLSHVSIPENRNDCWEWIGAKSRGYGKLSIEHKNHYAHRVSFELFVGPIPDGLYVLHCCDNPICVNPNHLFLGTHQDNMDDKVRKNRQFHGKGELNGSHKLTEKDVYRIRELRKFGYTLKVISEIYSVQLSSISNILSNKTWSWLK